MKRKLAALLLMMSVLLTGCGTAQVSNMMNIQDTTVPALQSIPTQAIRYQVDLELYEDASYAEDGQLLATYHVQVPVMTVCRENGTPLENPRTDLEKQAVTAAETFNQQFAVWTSEDAFQELTEDVQTELDFRLENGMLPMESYTMDLSCTVYQTEHLVSVAGLCYSYTGGAHPNTWQLGWNFDLMNGTFMNGVMASSNNTEFRKAVADELLRQAAETAQDNGVVPEEMFWPEYESLLANWDNYTVFFDSTGMTVAFSPYELAPYACGTQKFHLSYDWMQPLLDQRACQILELDCPKS